MKNSIKKLLLAFLWIVSAILLSSCAGTQSPIVGTWEGRMHDLPAVELTVRGGSGPLGGTIAFYVQSQDAGTWKTERQIEEPLIEPRFDGRVLSFQLLAGHGHADAADGVEGPADEQVLEFEFIPLSAKEGQLLRSHQEDATAIPLVKTK